MNFSTYRFTLDLQRHQSQMSISVFQYDSAVRLYISLTDGGNPYYLEEGCTAILYGKKADGTALIHPCMIENNTRIIYDFNEKTASEVGVVNCKIRIYHGGKEILTAPRFIIVVDERLVKDEEIDIHDESLTKGDLSALDQVLSTELERSEAEKVRIANENERIAAETTRIGDESVRFSNETARIAAESARESAEVLRSEAENERIAAETARDDAEKIRAENEERRQSLDLGSKVDKIDFEPSELNGANGILYGRYVKDGVVHDGGVVFGDVPNEGDIVQRAWNGNVNLPTDHSLIDKDEYAVPKGYVDTGLAVLQTGLEKGLENKPDIRTEKKAVYTTNTTGEQSFIYWSGGADANTIVRRTNNGTVATKTPLADDDATTKKYVDDFKEAVENTVNYTDSLIVALDKRVENIESNSIMYVDDESEAYEKIVPARSGKYALVKRVGGKSYFADVNCIDPTKVGYWDINPTVDDNGRITFTVFGDYLNSTLGEVILYCGGLDAGVYKYRVGIDVSSDVVGDRDYEMYEAGEKVEIHLYFATFEDNKDYGGEEDKIEITLSVMVLRDTSKTSESVVFEKDTSLAYKPYSEKRLVLVKPNKIESIGANLANARGWSVELPYYSDSILKTSNSYGTTINTTEAGGSITVTQSKWDRPESPTSFYNGFFAFVLNNPLSEGKKYNLSFDLTVINNPLNIAEGTAMLVLINGDGSNGSIKAQAIPKVGEKARTSCSFTYRKNPEYLDRSCIEFRNAGMSLIIGNVMITEESITDTTYVPYQAKPIDAIKIPEAVQALDGYGLGIDSIVYNYIECVDDKKLYWQKCKEFVFTGNEEWLRHESSTKFFTLTITDAKYDTNVLCLCNFFEGKTSGTSASHSAGSVWFQSTSNYPRFYIHFSSEVTTVEQAKQYLKNQFNNGNPLKIIYALAEPIVTDVTHLFNDDNEIIVQAGGRLRFVSNEENEAVPSEVMYAVRKVG